MDEREALVYFKKATEECPDNFIFWNLSGLTLHELKEYDEAIRFYDKAIRVNSNDSLNDKANTLYCLGRYDEAIECYDKVLKNSPSDSYAIEGKRLVVDKKWQLIKEKEKKYQ